MRWDEWVHNSAARPGGGNSETDARQSEGERCMSASATKQASSGETRLKVAATTVKVAAAAVAHLVGAEEVRVSQKKFAKGAVSPRSSSWTTCTHIILLPVLVPVLVRVVPHVVERIGEECTAQHCKEERERRWRWIKNESGLVYALGRCCPPPSTLDTHGHHRHRASCRPSGPCRRRPCGRHHHRNGPAAAWVAAVRSTAAAAGTASCLAAAHTLAHRHTRHQTAAAAAAGSRRMGAAVVHRAAAARWARYTAATSRLRSGFRRLDVSRSTGAGWRACQQRSGACSCGCRAVDGKSVSAISCERRRRQRAPPRHSLVVPLLHPASRQRPVVATAGLAFAAAAAAAGVRGMRRRLWRMWV